MEPSVLPEDFPRNQAEFDARFSSEEACAEYLCHWRWPQGFSCRKCGHPHFWRSSNGFLICTRCEHHHSVTSGTVMHGTRKPLRLWFKAMWWFTTRKSGVNAVNLQDLLGLGSYHTAWEWLQKLRSCTIRKDREQLSGVVEVDEIYIGGHASGKRGRGAEHKTAVCIAVEKKGPKLGRVRIQVVQNCGSDQVVPFVQANVVQGSIVKTDGWQAYGSLGQEGYDHRPVTQSKAMVEDSVLPGVHLIASLIKRLILGTFQGRFEPKYLQRYLDEYTFRFNRRKTNSVGKRFFRIAQQVAMSVPMPRWQIMCGAGNPALAN